MSRRLDVLHVADAAAAQIEIGRLLAGDDVLLVKASNSVRLGDVVAYLRDQSNLARESVS